MNYKYIFVEYHFFANVNLTLKISFVSKRIIHYRAEIESIILYLNKMISVRSFETVKNNNFTITIFFK